MKLWKHFRNSATTVAASSPRAGTGLSPVPVYYSLSSFRLHMDTRPPVKAILLHDLLSSNHAWKQSLHEYIGSMPMNGYSPTDPLEIYCPDFRGHGFSDSLPFDMNTLADVSVEDVHALQERIVGHQCCLGGIGFGAMVAAQAALKYSKYFSSLVLFVKDLNTLKHCRLEDYSLLDSVRVLQRAEGNMSTLNQRLSDVVPRLDERATYLLNTKVSASDQKIGFRLDDKLLVAGEVSCLSPGTGTPFKCPTTVFHTEELNEKDKKDFQIMFPESVFSQLKKMIVGADFLFLHAFVLIHLCLFDYLVIPTMSSRFFTTRTLAVIVLLLIVQCTTFTQAIHEDEQGKFDWTVRLLGDVEVVAVPPVNSPTCMYLASTDGAVGMVSLAGENPGTLLHRQFLHQRPRCLVTTPQYLVAVMENGEVHYMESDSLSSVTTLHLSSVHGNIVHASCIAEGRHVIIGIVAGNVSAVYEINPEYDYTDGVPPVSTKLSLPDSHNILLEEKHVYISNTTDCHIFQRPDFQMLESHPGMCEDASPQGYVLRGHRIMLRKVGNLAEHDPANTWTCDECYFHFLKYPGEEGETPVPIKSFVLPKGLIIDFGNHRVHVSDLSDGSRVLFGFADLNTQMLSILVKTHHGNLIMVNQRGEILWERAESLAFPAATTIIESPDHVDHFHFNKQIMIATRKGAVYTVPVNQQGSSVRLVADLMKSLPEALDAPSIEEVKMERLLEKNRGHARMTASYNGATAVVHFDLLHNQVHIEKQVDYLLSTPEFSVTKELEVSSGLHTDEEVNLFTVNQTSGHIQGYIAKGARATPTWSVHVAGPIVAHALPESHLLSFRNNLRLYPNKTEEETQYEVRHRFPMHNVIAVAHMEKETADSLSTLVVTAVDTVTGSVHGIARHTNVEGEVKMIIVENAILYYFLDAKKMRYCFGVWELFQVEEGDVVTKESGVSPPSALASFFEKNNALFSSRAALPPVVKVQTLGVFGGPLADLGVTTSLKSVAKKNVVLLFQTGRVALVELNRLMRGRPVFFTNEPQEAMEFRDNTQIVVPPFLYATHRLRLAKPQHLAISPTGLESSNHIVVSGMDLFYVRYSSGKAFDLLNSDFNKLLLLGLVGGLSVSCVIARFFKKNIIALQFTNIIIDKSKMTLIKSCLLSVLLLPRTQQTAGGKSSSSTNVQICEYDGYQLSSLLWSDELLSLDVDWFTVYIYLLLIFNNFSFCCIY
eukprot:gene4420-3219_t